MTKDAGTGFTGICKNLFDCKLNRMFASMYCAENLVKFESLCVFEVFRIYLVPCFQLMQQCV